MAKILLLHVAIAPIIALFIAGIITLIQGYPIWSVILWALASLWLIASLISNKKIDSGAIHNGQPLEFRVKVEELSIQQSSYLLDKNHFQIQESPKCIIAKISFKTNQVIQIASLHLEINSIDPRDIIEPDPRLAQGFHFPYTLNQSETYKFQFEVIPAKKPGDYKTTLRVLAGGDWYSDGPYSINL